MTHRRQTSSLRYFAYGSNMLTARLRARVPSADPVGAAALDGYAIAFSKLSLDGSAKATIVRNPGAKVFGVVFELSRKDLKGLAAAEEAYSEREVAARLVGTNETIECLTYFGQRIRDGIRPYSWYKALVLAGATEHSLPTSYVRALVETPSWEDPDQERRKRNEETLADGHEGELASEPLPEAVVAVLYQCAVPPPVEGIVKPFKWGGYRDSGADIAFALRRSGVRVVAPVEDPQPDRCLDWVFPDDERGILEALGLGANVLWANTVLHTKHALGRVDLCGAEVVGQRLDDVEHYDDKRAANELLLAAGLPVARAAVYRRGTEATDRSVLEGLLVEEMISPPWVIKPLRGRGSQGVVVVENLSEAVAAIEELTTAYDAESGSSLYGTAAMIEEYLPGEEITITVLPSGRYAMGEMTQARQGHWALPAVRRSNHQDGVAPYSGVVSVTANSEAVRREDSTPELETIVDACAEAGELLDAIAPTRIDCRVDVEGRFKMFDVNLKPNMTGPGRPGRDDQDSLMMIAARELGWKYDDLVRNILLNCRHTPDR